MQPNDLNRIDNEVQHSRIVDMHFALQRLRSIVSFMNTGAHPDDETSAMLAALGFRDGLDISYACANRGEGGQNDIGTESGTALGTLRTAEMERAAAVLNMRLYWLSSSTSDSISDFRFSKSGVETLEKWQHQHALERFVSIVRREKPDIICPTFLDIPGQHGHHRAMTQLAHEVIEAAADNQFVVEHKGVALPAWSVAKLYLPAWGGGGTAYDDELPPPSASLEIKTTGFDDITGWSWERIGQQSRRFHKTQGMGRWVAAGTERNWPLHLAKSIFAGEDNHVTDHLPEGLGQLSAYAQAPEIERELIDAQRCIDATHSAFPSFRDILLFANDALTFLHNAKQHCPPNAQTQVLHRLQRKIDQLSRVVHIASGVQVHAVAANNLLRPGEETDVTIEVRHASKSAGVPVSDSIILNTDERWEFNNGMFSPATDATPTDPYPAEFFPDRARAPSIDVELDVNGVVSTTSIEMVNTPVILAPYVINLANSSVIINKQASRSSFSIAIDKCCPSTAEITIDTPANWSYTSTQETLSVNLPSALEPGLYELDLYLDGLVAHTEHIIDYPHISTRALTSKASICVLVLDIQLPQKHIAYVGGGNDRVAQYLSAMGINVTELDDDALVAGRGLDQYDTLLIGLFAMRTRPMLAQNMHYVHRWIENGGHLVTLYHRPWDNWNPDTIPPRFLEIGQPSLRYRVTNENASVTVLQPEHPLLNCPNKITDDDWQNWKKERGLYFAKAWHKDYQALLSMHDTDEEPLLGSLLSANIGAGRHTHTSLVLHHQMDNLVSGSFRLMANLLN